jgi:hypothetical protein
MRLALRKDLWRKSQTGERPHGIRLDAGSHDGFGDSRTSGHSPQHYKSRFGSGGASRTPARPGRGRATAIWIVEGKIDAMIQSVVNIQRRRMQGQLASIARLEEAQGSGNVLGAHRVPIDASETDVRRCSRSCVRTGSHRRSSRGLPRGPRRTSRPGAGLQPAVERLALVLRQIAWEGEDHRLLAGARTGAQASKYLQIAIFVAVSKTVSGLWVRRGFKSLPLRLYGANPLAMRVRAT